MTKISDLPVNLVEEILSKVPLKNIRAVRLTCKEWDTISKSQSFSKMHIDRINGGESMMVVALTEDYNLYLMNVVNEDPFIERIGKLTCLDKQNTKISDVFHCDGLLLCVLKDDANKVIVWNPYWGQTRSIECRYSVRRNKWDNFTYGLGYEDKGSSCRNYKFLRFIEQCVDYAVKDRFIRYEIYNFESSSWKTHDVTPHWHIYYQRGVSLKGNTYWVSGGNTEENAFENHIICFDFTRESFGPLMRLPFDVTHIGDNVTLSCVREEKLAVLFTHYGEDPLVFEIWITTKIEAEKMSWSKFLTLVDPELEHLISYHCFFIDGEKKVAMNFEEEYAETFNIIGEDGYFKKVELGECLGRDIDCLTNACSYVPSLVEIKQPASAGSKRKQESDQNMARFVDGSTSLNEASWSKTPDRTSTFMVFSQDGDQGSIEDSHQVALGMVL